MKHQYNVYFRPTTTHPKEAVRQFVDRFSGLKADPITGTVHSSVEDQARRLFEEAKREGFATALDIRTTYEPEDALAGELGILHVGSRDDGGRFPSDAFDFSTGCPRCGLGAAQVSPLILPRRSIRHKGYFNHGAEWSARVTMRSEIGREIVAATGQPWCMRHPVTRDGAVVEEWLEPLPCATMPPLSRESEGVRFGSSTSGSLPGEPPEVIEPCTACGRTTWDYDWEEHRRLVYPRVAIEAAQQHAVVVMHEPYGAFPEFDPVKRTCKTPIGLPWLLFSRKAIEVLVKYLESDDPSSSASIQPVFSA